MAITLAAYAAVWLEHCDVKEHTRLRYPALLEQHINPTLGTVPLAHLTGAAVPAWHASLDPKHPAIKALGVHSELEPLLVHQPGAPVVEHCAGYPPFTRCMGARTVHTDICHSIEGLRVR